MHIIDTGVHPIKAWTDGVPFEQEAQLQVSRLARLPFVFSHVAVMPDVHPGRGSTVGSVFASEHAIIPAAVSTDIGCGIAVVKTSMKADDLPDSLTHIRQAIERIVPVGMAAHKNIPSSVEAAWKKLSPGFAEILKAHPKITDRTQIAQLASLGGGNHYEEVALDEDGYVWIMVHSGSRGVGNRIGTYFIERARKDMLRQGIGLEDSNLAYFTDDQQAFHDYLQAVGWAQDYAKENRRLILQRTLDGLRDRKLHLPKFKVVEAMTNCHHNYVAQERHFDTDVWVTRKGAVRAGLGERVIIAGSMGARTYIARGKGNPQSFASCSHGAGRVMDRNTAKESISMAEFKKSMAGIEARVERQFIDEAPAAYKPIEAVMRAQEDLVEVEHELRQVICIKG
jgi:tRNA-splicing ligase RtcB (3'-phosphate/5'-hydroxy nucleic acid ligase)